jgi:hypothetical protein
MIHSGASQPPPLFTRYTPDMRNIVLAAIVGLLAVAIILPPEPRLASPPSTDEYQRGYDAGFNDGFRKATRDNLEHAERKDLGEFFYDQQNRRMAFRYYADGPLVEPPDDPGVRADDLPD